LQACGSASAAAVPAHEDGGDGWWWWPLTGLGALLVLAVPLSPLLWRERMRGRRLGGHDRTPGGAAAHTLAAWQELMDSAWDHGIAPDESLTPRKAADRIVRLGHLDPAAGAAVHRVADAVEQVLYAPAPRPAPGTAQDVRRVTEALRATVSTGTRLRARFLPRSSVRVLWTLSARWSSLRTRLTAARPTLRRPSGQRS
ncbi:DUF4129 domain-containing protein, partial [Streptomyces sp. NPDC001356]